VLVTVAVFVVVAVLEWLIHGVLLQAAYQRLAAVFRPDTDAQRLMGMLFVVYAVYAGLFSLIYTHGYEADKPGLGQGTTASTSACWAAWSEIPAYCNWTFPEMEHLSAPLRIHAERMFPGAHVFVQTGQADLLRAVREELALIPDQTLGGRARRPQRARSRPLLP
jgi:hypothetical protein